MSTPVAVVMGSQSDWETKKEACDALTQFGVGWKAEVVSATGPPSACMTSPKAPTTMAIR